MHSGYMVVPDAKANASKARKAEFRLRDCALVVDASLGRIATALGGGESRPTAITLEGVNGEHTIVVENFIGDVVYELLRHRKDIKRIIIEPMEG